MEKINFYTQSSLNQTPELRMVIDVSGNVGIGESNPTKSLEVVGDISFNGNLYQNGALFTGGSTIDETTDVSLNNLKVHGDLSANDASFNVVDSSSINITGTSYMQSIIPSTNNTYSLGDPSSVWKDIYIGPGSLYIDGQKVLESDANTIVVGADENQNLKLNTTGTGVTQIESANGIQINSTGSGNIELGSTGSGIVRITNNLALNGNVEIFNDSSDMVKINDSLLVTGDISFNGNLSQNGANINTIYATIASPTLTGTPLAPTASSGTNTTQLATTAFVSTAVSNLVNAAPGALDTLSELAAALDNSANFATNVTTTLGDLQTQINTKVTASSTDTFTNKTIDADGTGNSITNIDNANIKASAGIVYSKLSIADNDLTIAKTSGLQTALDEEFCKIGTQEYAITVASKTATNYYNGTGSSSAFFINGNEGPYLKFTPGKKYKFLQDDGTNSNHPFKFYLEVNKTTEYSTNVTLSGTAGQSGSYTEIEITDSTPTKLYYQCANHSYMGNVVYIDGYSNIADGDLTIAKTSGLQVALDAKQATLTSGTNITITGTTISASGGGGGLTDLSASSISDLSDVSFNPISTTNGQALVWNSTDSVWEAGTVASSGSTIDETTDVSVNNLSVHHSLDVSNSLIVSDGSTTSTTQTSYWYSDSSNFSWSLHNDGTSTAPVSRNNHTSVIDNSGNIIIFGGDDSVSERNDAWKYSISSNSWSELFSSTTPSTGSWDQISGSPASSSITGGVGYNKELYIMCDSGATFHKYNPSTDVWTTLASKSQSYYGGPQMVSHKGHIYTIDSVNGERSVWDYNISANSWTKLSNASDSAHDRYSTHASIYNGIIYVFAGRHIPYNQGYFSDIWTYNISTNTWSEITSVTTTLDGNSASFPTFGYGSYTSHGDNIYMVYGLASSGSAMNTVYIYNITNNTMTGYTTSMPGNYTSTVSLHENCLYMFGGYVSSSNVNTLIKYDLETKTHTTISQSGTWPSARRDLRWATLGNTFYALGGYTSSSSTDVWRYTLDDTPQKIKNTSNVLNGDEIITVFGGSNGNVCYSSIYNFNLTNNNWSYITPSKDTVAGDTTHGNQRGIPLERDDHTFVKYNNKAYLFGGKNGSTTYYDTWEYDLSTTTWTKKALALSSYARYGHTSIIYNGNMYVFGGYNGTTYFNNVLKYDITNDSWSEYNDGTGASTPSSRYGHVANLIQPEMIIFGGMSTNGAVEDSYAFDFSTNTWHLLDNDDANRPINPQSTSAELYNTGTGYKWFVFGGSMAISIASQILYENFEDQSYTGNVTSATIVSGGYNSSYALKGGGKNSYDRWRLGDTTFQSVSFWYYRDKANSGNQLATMFDNNRGTNGENVLFFQTSSGGNLDKVHFTSSSSAVSKLYIDGVDESSAIHTSWSSGWSSTTYADNTWHHFYLEFASSQTSPITFGQCERADAFYAAPSEYVKWGGGGKFDNVRIFSGALTTTQIAFLLENNNKMHVADISNVNLTTTTTIYNGFTYNTNNDGRVSIGKLNPTKELDVVGDGIFTGSVTSSGSVLTSDDRVKHNEQSIVNALSTISKLRPKHYFKTGSHLYDASHNFVLNANGVPVNISNTPLILNKDYTVETGIIAQEIQSIPELKFAVQNTTPLGVDYNSIHCTHIAATKELHQMVQNQQIQIETIKELVQSQQTTIEEQQTIIEEQQQEIEHLKLYNIESNNQINQLQQENQQLKHEIAIIKGHLGL